MKFRGLLAFFAAGMSAGYAGDRPNVLFIMADDLRPELGCYGVAGMVTPNLDKLASQSVLFDRAYCQAPLCNPSRSSMLSGHYPTTTQIRDNHGSLEDLHPDWVTLPEYFRKHGYSTINVGKIFHGGKNELRSWSDAVLTRVPAGLKLPDEASWQRMLGAESERGEEYNPRLSDRAVAVTGDGDQLRDYYFLNDGLEALNRYKDQPFFLAVGFSNPHAPPSAPQKYFDLYDPAKMPLPPDFQPRPAEPPGFPRGSISANTDLFVDRDATPEEARKMIRAYRAAVSWFDSNVGRLLDELGRLGLAKNTIVVVTTDHGYHLGEKGKWSKMNSLFEVATRVPLIMRVPGAAGDGRVCPRVVELVDLYPTLAQLCGLPPPAGMEGQSFARLLENPDAKWNFPAYSINKFLDLSVRTEKWRYAVYPSKGGDDMLFDEAKDPHEMTNLANDPGHADVVAEMKALLARLPEPAGSQAAGKKTP